MNQKVNGYTANYLKRQAKAIGKNQQIPHRIALDKAASNAGFSNWKDFLHQANSALKVPYTPNNQEPKTVQIPTRQSASQPLNMNPYRKLLVAATNELLKQRLISLDSKDNLPIEGGSGHLFAKLFDQPSVIIYWDISYDELQITVWWKYDHESHPQGNLTGRYREQFQTSTPMTDKVNYKDFVGVVASAWLERKTGKHLQGKGNDAIMDRYTRRGEKSELEKLPVPVPNGFRAEGQVFI